MNMANFEIFMYTSIPIPKISHFWINDYRNDQYEIKDSYGLKCYQVVF